MAEEAARLGSGYGLWQESPGTIRELFNTPELFREPVKAGNTVSSASSVAASVRSVPSRWILKYGEPGYPPALVTAATAHFCWAWAAAIGESHVDATRRPVRGTPEPRSAPGSGLGRFPRKCRRHRKGREGREARRGGWRGRTSGASDSRPPRGTASTQSRPAHCHALHRELQSGAGAIGPSGRCPGRSSRRPRQPSFHSNGRISSTLAPPRSRSAS